MTREAQPARAVWFVGARQVELRTEEVPPPGEHEITVRARMSLVSAGTELLIYRGEANPDEDIGLATARGSFRFPVKYAYQTVGEVTAVGDKAKYRVGEHVFCRHPHQEVFTIPSQGRLVAPVPEDVAPQRAVFLNLLEVALNAQLDVPTRLGDRVAKRTAGRLAVVDPVESRRKLALDWGADFAFEPSQVEAGVAEMTDGAGVDIAVEATGAPAALQSAIRCTGQEGTVLVMSFFGARLVPLILSPEFHYRRIRVISSQTSSIGSGLQPRWSFERRTSVAFDLLRQDWLRTPISQRLPFGRAAEAYELLDQHRDQAQAVLLTYD